MNKNLVHYINLRFSQRTNESDIIEELKKTGWSIPDINIALAEAKGILPPPRPLPGPGELLKESFFEYKKKYGDPTNLNLPYIYTFDTSKPDINNQIEEAAETTE